MKKMKQMDEKLEFDYEPSYDLESLQLGSVELLFHYLRFKIFPDVSEQKKKDLFYLLSYVACRQPENLEKITSFAQANDLEGMMTFAQEKKIQPREFLDRAQEEVDSCAMENNTNTTRLNTNKKIEVFFYKKPETMIDGWFVENNPYLAYSLFQHLLFSKQDDKYLKMFIEDYKSRDPIGRKQLVVYAKHNAVTI